MLAGCAESDDSESKDDDTSSERNRDRSASQAKPSELVGDFQVRWVARNAATQTAARTTVLGVVKDGPTPPSIVWHVTQEDGPCKLLEPEAPFCETPCGGRAVCAADDTCVPYPAPSEVGSVYLSGLTTKEFEMKHAAGNYMPVGVQLAYPPCEEASRVKLRATGGDYPAFEREARCIAPLSFDATPKLERGKDLTLEWVPPGEPTLARIQVKIDVSHHGGSKGEIECDTEDDGELTIGSDMLDRLVDLGVAGFPVILLTRVNRSDGEDELQGITLTLFESVERPVELPGLVSCTEDRHCPSDQRCAANLMCTPR